MGDSPPTTFTGNSPNPRRRVATRRECRECRRHFEGFIFSRVTRRPAALCPRPFFERGVTSVF